MGSKIAEAKIGVQAHQANEVINLGVNIRDNGIYKNTTEYPSPIILQLDFTTVLDLLIKREAATQRGSVQNTTDRDETLELFYGYLDKLCMQTNLLYKGNKSMLQLSGFPTSADPTPASLPTAPSIVRVDRLTATTAKVLININRGPLDKKKERFEYTVYISDDAAGTNMRSVLRLKNSRLLILKNLTLDKAVWISVSKSNTAGESEISSKLKYTAY